MTVVDDRPKTLIKLNAIDAAVLLVLVVMIPITYAAYLLFRTPPARLLSVTPTEIIQGTTPRLLITGANLRPFMRVSLNDTQAKNFMIASVNRHHGMVHQLLGDGLMAIFGAPLSFGNDAANAVRAALEIVERVQREVEAKGTNRVKIFVTSVRK